MRFSSVSDWSLTGFDPDVAKLRDLARLRREAGREVIDLTTGELDLPPTPETTEATNEALRTSQPKYGSPAGIDTLRQAICHLLPASSVRPTPEQVVVTAGAQNALAITALALAGPGDEVLIPIPAYNTYLGSFGLGGARVIPIPSGRPNMRLDLPAVARAITNRTRVIAVSDPSNPSGSVLTEDEAHQLLRLGRANDITIVIDRVYADFVQDRAPVAFWDNAAGFENLVIIDSTSKSFAMSGWRMGWCIGPTAFARRAERIAALSHHSLPTFIQEAAAATLRRRAAEGKEARAQLQETAAIFRKRRELVLQQLLRTPGLTTIIPEGGVFILIAPQDGILDSKTFQRSLLEIAGVVLLDAASFSAPGWCRLALTAPADSLLQACSAISQVLALAGATEETHPPIALTA